MKEVKLYHLSPTGGLAEGEKLGCISVYLKSDYESLREELAASKRGITALAVLDSETLRSMQQRLTAAEQRNAELVELLKYHGFEWYSESRTLRCVECGSSEIEGHKTGCKIEAALKPTESGASE